MGNRYVGRYKWWLMIRGLYILFFWGVITIHSQGIPFSTNQLLRGQQGFEHNALL